MHSVNARHFDGTRIAWTGLAYKFVLAPKFSDRGYSTALEVFFKNEKNRNVRTFSICFLLRYKRIYVIVQTKLKRFDFARINEITPGNAANAKRKRISRTTPSFSTRPTIAGDRRKILLPDRGREIGTAAATPL